MESKIKLKVENSEGHSATITDDTTVIFNGLVSLTVFAAVLSAIPYVLKFFGIISWSYWWIITPFYPVALLWFIFGLALAAIKLGEKIS